MGAAGGGKRRFETYKPASVDWVGRPVMALRIEIFRSTGMMVWCRDADEPNEFTTALM
jgi:hypothetical protein